MGWLSTRSVPMATGEISTRASSLPSLHFVFQTAASMSCCWSKKLFGSRRSKREDRYKVKEEGEEVKAEETAQDAPPAGEEPKKYSWETRDQTDPNNYWLREIHGQVLKKVGKDGGPLQIENCTESTLIFLHSSTQIIIDDCRNCTIVLGPTEGSVFARDCADCIILTSCSQFRTRDCTSVRVGILCSTEPIVENCNDMSFYHLAMYYPEYKDQMHSVKLRPFTNRVTSAHDFTPTGAGGAGNFKVFSEAVQLTEYKETVLREHGVLTNPSPDEILPRFSEVRDNDPTYMFLLGKAEPMDELTDRGIQLLRDVYAADMKVMASYDVITKTLDPKMIPFAGKAERMILFKLSGFLGNLKSEVDYDIIDENDAEALQNLLVHLNAKNSG